MDFAKKIFLQKLKLKGISLWLMFEGLVVGVARGDETVVNFRFLLTSASLLVFFKSSAVSFQSRLSLAYAIRNAPFHTCVLSWALKEKKNAPASLFDLMRAICCCSDSVLVYDDTFWKNVAFSLALLGPVFFVFINSRKFHLFQNRYRRIKFVYFFINRIK